MAKRRCILHIGSPRTGTTSIQEVLKTNSRRLLEQGFLVPTLGQDGKGVHPSLAHHLAGLPSRPEWAGAEAGFLRELEATVPHTVLISAEILWGVVAEESRLEHLVGRLRGLDFDIAILCYVRNQPQFLNSSYSQGIRTFRHAKPFDRFVRRHLGEGRRSAYSQRIEAARRHGVEFLARPYTDEVRKAGVIDDYLAAVGATLPRDGAQDFQMNRSVGPFYVALARRLFHRALGGRKPTRKRARACSNLLKERLDAIGIRESAYCGLSAPLVSEIQDAHRQDNERFAALAWRKPWSDVFAADLQRDYVTNDYAVAGVPSERRPQLIALTRELGPRLTEIAAED